MKNFLSKLPSLFNQKDLNERESSLNIAQSLKDFVEEELLPGLNFTPSYFWVSLENIIEKFSNRNKDLLSKKKKYVRTLGRAFLLAGCCGMKPTSPRKTSLT